MDDHDNEPARFWSHLVAALQTVRADLGQEVLPALQAGQRVPNPLLLSPLLNDLAALSEEPGTSEIVLVLDDYHLIFSPAIDDGISFLLEHQPPNLHLAISTRADPPLPVFRLRARNQLTELRSDELRFTSVEAATFLNSVMNLDLAPADVQALEARTKGWIVGLQLAALALQGTSSLPGSPAAQQFIAEFTDSHHHVLEYLTGEVVHVQSEQVKRFLLETSILDRLCAPLCDAVTGRPGSQQMLSDLQHRNLFVVPLDSEHHWLRYHHLFAGSQFCLTLPSDSAAWRTLLLRRAVPAIRARRGLAPPRCTTCLAHSREGCPFSEQPSQIDKLPVTVRIGSHQLAVQISLPRPAVAIIQHRGAPRCYRRPGLLCGPSRGGPWT